MERPRRTLRATSSPALPQRNLLLRECQRKGEMCGAVQRYCFRSLACLGPWSVFCVVVSTYFTEMMAVFSLSLFQQTRANIYRYGSSKKRQRRCVSFAPARVAAVTSCVRLGLLLYPFGVQTCAGFSREIQKLPALDYLLRELAIYLADLLHDTDAMQLNTAPCHLFGFFAAVLLPNACVSVVFSPALRKHEYDVSSTCSVLRTKAKLQPRREKRQNLC